MTKLLTVVIIMLSVLSISAEEVAFLGVITQDIPLNQYINYGITDGYGVLLKSTVSNSAAEKAGLEKGMILRKLNDEKIYTKNQLQRMLENKEPEEKVSLTIFEDNEEKQIKITLGKRPLYNNEKTAWLGVVCSEAEQNDEFKENYGLLVKEVTPESAAEAAGIRENDILLSFESDKLYSVDQLRHILKTYTPGDKVTLHYWRDGIKKKEDIELGGRSIEDIFGEGFPKFDGLFDDLDIDIDLGDLYSTWDMMGLPGRVHIYSFPDSTRKLLGVMVSSLSDEKLKELKLENGVLVKSIIENSTAEEAGIKKGDIILEINDVEIKEKSDISVALEDISIGDKLTAKVLREEKALSIEMTLKEAPQDLGNVYKMSIDDDHSIEMMFDDDRKFFFNKGTKRDSLDCYDREEYRYEFLKKGSKGPL